MIMKIKLKLKTLMVIKNSDENTQSDVNVET